MSSLKVSKKVTEIPQQRKRDSTTVGDDNVDSPPNVYRCANVQYYVTLCKTGFWSVWSPWLKTLLPLVLFNPSNSFVLLLFLENPADPDASDKLTLGDFYQNCASSVCLLSYWGFYAACLFVQDQYTTLSPIPNASPLTRSIPPLLHFHNSPPTAEDWIWDLSPCFADVGQESRDPRDLAASIPRWRRQL